MELITVDEAAKALRVSQSTVRRWLRLKLIPSRKLGRRRLILKRDLEQIIENGLNLENKKV